MWTCLAVFLIATALNGRSRFRYWFLLAVKLRNVYHGKPFETISYGVE